MGTPSSLDLTLCKRCEGKVEKGALAWMRGGFRPTHRSILFNADNGSRLRMFDISSTLPESYTMLKESLILNFPRNLLLVSHGY